MADKDNNAEGTPPSAEALYNWWLGALPNMLGALGTPEGKADAPAAPFPVGSMTQALGLAQGWLGSLYENYLRAVVTARPGEEGKSAETFVTDQVNSMANRLVGMGQAFSGTSGLAEMGSRLTGTPLAAFSEAMKPLSLNLERAYGGLADAFGLAPVRAMDQAMRDMALAAMARRQAQTEYLEVVVGALRQGSENLTRRFAEMAQKGESVDSMLGLVRLWARTTDEAMHAAMQSPRALEAQTKLLRASSRARLQTQQVVAIASEALNIPTRGEVDAAYREIQELKRELRRLRKPPPVEAAEAAPVAAAAPARKRVAAKAAAPEATPKPTRKPTGKPAGKAPRKTSAKKVAA